METVSTPNLQEMVDELKQKSSKGFGLLYDYYAGVIYGVVCRIIKDPVPAEDVLQEIFVKVWHNIEHFNVEKGTFFTWLISITRNTAIDYVRSRQFKQHLKIQTLTYNEYERGNSKGPEVTEMSDVYSNVARLEPKYRLIIDLVYIKGYTHEEAAKLASLPLGTVKTRARAALQLLKKQLTP